jgi:hypothetical protein
MITVNGDEKRTWKKAVVAYLKLLPWQSFEMTE